MNEWGCGEEGRGGEGNSGEMEGEETRGRRGEGREEGRGGERRGEGERRRGRPGEGSRREVKTNEKHTSLPTYNVYADLHTSFTSILLLVLRIFRDGSCKTAILAGMSVVSGIQ